MHAGFPSRAGERTATGLEEKMELHLEIHREEDRYTGYLRRPGQSIGDPLGELALGPRAEVEVKGRKFVLEELTRALILHRPDDLDLAFDERGQLEIGKVLYEQTLKKAYPNSLPSDGDVFLRIHTDDEQMARLPWVLLSPGGRFLVQGGWSVALNSCNRPPADCLLPSCPRLLCIVPQPKDVGPTRATEHLEELEKKLSLFFPELTRGDGLQTVCDWEGFKSKAVEFKPHAIYYYGHGIARQTGASTRLLFENPDDGKADDRPASDFARVLGDLEKKPMLVYVNCCHGDAGGLLGLGRQLEGEHGIPAAITNRTAAYVPEARAQALFLWERLLLYGDPPHVALASLYRSTEKLGLTGKNERWMVPVLHANYREWRATGGVLFMPEGPAGNWRLKIDRERQIADVEHLTGVMLREGKPRCRAFVWYGQRGDGVEIFHERVEKELGEILRESRKVFHPVRPDWPTALGDTPDHACCSFMNELLAAFDVDSTEDIGYNLRSLYPGDRKVLVYVRHPSVKSPAKENAVPHVINPATLKIYLDCWDRQILPYLEPNQFVMFTVSFVVNKPDRFKKAMETEGSKISGLASHPVQAA